MLRIVIEQDEGKTTQTIEGSQNASAAISGGAPAPHITKIVSTRSAPANAMMPQQMAMAAANTQTIMAKDAGEAPRWLAQAVKSLVSKAAEKALRYD